LRKTVRRFEWFESVDSTMTVAAKLAREGCAHGTVVGADQQTAGVGRHGHSWHSPKGTGLYISIVLRFPRPVPLVMLALGLAAREAIAEATGLAPDLRWPNDVLIDGRKCAGIIAQLDGDAVVAGIGINVGQTEFPPEFEATSIQLAGSSATREDILERLLQAIDRYCAETPEAILRMFEASSSYARGRRVRVEQTAIEGVTTGLDASGFLIVRQDDGRETTVHAGGVRPCS
jgi:BirA family biotin operon repressor/biotin-[acetyl-CoA-carboxylase] ligase